MREELYTILASLHVFHKLREEMYTIWASLHGFSQPITSSWKVLKCLITTSSEKGKGSPI
jgi:hypothetical protein